MHLIPGKTQCIFLASMLFILHAAAASGKDLSASSSNAVETAPPFPVAGNLSRAIQKYTGLTWLGEKSLELSAELASKLVLGGHSNLRIKAYSLSDCFFGKFKSVEADLKNCSYKKIPLADLKLATSTPLQIRLFKRGQKAAGVGAPVMVSVTGTLSEAQISRALASPKIASELSFLRLELPGLGDQHLQIIEPEVKIENGKVKISSWLITANAPKETGVFVKLSSTPYLEGDRYIMLKNTSLDSSDIHNPEEFSRFSQELLNPLLDFARFDRKTHAIRISSFKLDEQKLHFAAKLLLVPKAVPPPEKEQKLSRK